MKMGIMADVGTKDATALVMSPAVRVKDMTAVMKTTP